ncbi:hypothetical protein KDW_61440 [Dictyobacter vulcani]|uniref:Beta-lactamase class A catalytic domain-containing protein n=1 Tax=Dictyobacter vulcani TaxID=2607529 RepID=A0A5J4KY41_9CHLR|nr:serine hydrolase [Dictyobacter vulcani]GER91982.1 hypothetical protein KDW_61440 [Dictyobacter vulcani]
MNPEVERWNQASSVTPPYANFTAFFQRETVAPFFQPYYQRYAGAQNLGHPLTSAFPIQQGWLQFFENGALFDPLKHTLPVQTSSTNMDDLINAGLKDAPTGIVRLPLLQALLTAGSLVPLGGQGSTTTYVDLRKATAPDFVQPLPGRPRIDYLSMPEKQDIIIPVGHRGKTRVGHRIPSIFWTYINQPTVAPHGWQKDFGTPLTEALPFTISFNGQPHHMLTQAFLHDGLLLDWDSPGTTGQPAIQRLPTGIDYLRTFNFPAITLTQQQPVWSQQETVLMTRPGINQVLAHIGPHFPLTLLGATTWVEGQLWYRVQWASFKRVSTGWMMASASTFDKPISTGIWSTVDILSPQLAHYLTTIGSNVGMSVYDLSRNRTYVYNTDRQFIAASAIKIPIMLAFLDLLEHQKHEPDEQAMFLLTSMIENSNNDSTSIIYYNQIGDAAGLAAFLHKIGLNNFTADPDAWGNWQLSPQMMVDLLTLLTTGKILTPHHRALALDLMSHIEPDQRFGIGDTAQPGASIAMKNGWLISDTDNLWVVNSSGIIVTKREQYIIAVYTQSQPSLEAAQAIIRHVCKSIASLLS